jgi:hypothetical protein
MSGTKEVLLRLRKKILVERRHFRNIQENSSNQASKERAFGEATVCGFVIGLIDEEIRSLPEGK